MGPESSLDLPPPAQATRRSAWRRPLTWWLAHSASISLCVLLLGDLAACLGDCHVDLAALHKGPQYPPDLYQSAWILAWVDRVLLTDPANFWNAPNFHPFPLALRGAENMLGIALPLLPLQALGPTALLLHQSGVLLSFLILGMTSAALLRGLTGSDWIAFVGSALAMFMPWRMHEFGHVQLLSVHWFPLIWLLSARILLGPSRAWHPPMLALVLFLQLSTSFYVAYQLTVTLAVLLPILWWVSPRSLRGLVRLALPMGLAYGGLLGLSLPYLELEAAGLSDEIESITRSAAPKILMMLLYTPGVGLFAVLGVVKALRRPTVPPGDRLPLGAFVGALALLVPLTVWLALGSTRLPLGALSLPSPLELLSPWLPGYRHLRLAMRWRSIPGLALPLLAAIGLFLVEARFLARLYRERVAAKFAFRALFGLVLWIGMPVTPVPVARLELPADPAVYRRLAELPEGPVLELPWPSDINLRGIADARYMLAGTLHWKPLINGYTRFWPPGTHFLYRIARDLPGDAALDLLARLAGLRWIVLHRNAIDAEERRLWDEEVESARLRRVFADRGTWILELPGDERRGVLQSALVTAPDPARTVTGLPRASIRTGLAASRWSAEWPRSIRSMQSVPLRLRIENAGRDAWPTVDPDPNGLLQLRYRYATRSGRIVLEGLLPLLPDVLPGVRWERALSLPAPGEPQRYRLRLDLVQLFEGEPVASGLPLQKGRLVVRAWDEAGEPAPRSSAAER